MHRTEPAKNGAIDGKRTRQMLYSAAALSFLAEAIHLWVAPEHYLEWLGYGAFFLAAAVFQGVLGAALLFRARQGIFFAGALGNLSIVLLWAYTRAVAVPLGPMAGETEDVGSLDLVCVTSEVALAVLLAALWWRFLAPAAGLRKARRPKPADL